MTEPTTPAGEKPVVTAFPKPPAEPQTFSPNEIKELVTTGFNAWQRVTEVNADGADKQRLHELEMARLEYAHVERENDAERREDSRSARQSLWALLIAGLLLLAIFIALLVAQQAALAADVLKVLLGMASGIGLAQARPIRTFFERRRQRKTDEDAENEAE